ncbi:MAG: ATP-binding protein [Firmicutes bacterium]|nr:ATP-binding protein [Bacillota bacterium]
MSGTPERQTHSEAGSYKCPLCKDKGLILQNDAARVCGCMKARRLENLMRSSNISEEFVYKSFETFSLKGSDKRIAAAFQTARRYSDDLVKRVKSGEGLKGSPWLGLLGVPGSGKTHLAHAAVKPLFELGVKVLFFNWVSSFKEWMAWHSSDQKNRVDEIRQEIYNCDLLVLDDLCKECVNETWIREIYGIIDYRYRKGLPMIYTSEYYAELIEMLSEATASRLFEMSGRADPPAMALMLLNKKEDPLALNYRLKYLRKPPGI